jgi:hypothetical protein
MYKILLFDIKVQQQNRVSLFALITTSYSESSVRVEEVVEDLVGMS